MNSQRNLNDLNALLSSVCGILDEARGIQTQFESDYLTNNLSFWISRTIIRSRDEPNVRSLRLLCITTLKIKKV